MGFETITHLNDFLKRQSAAGARPIGITTVNCSGTSTGLSSGTKEDHGKKEQYDAYINRLAGAEDGRGIDVTVVAWSSGAVNAFCPHVEYDKKTRELFCRRHNGNADRPYCCHAFVVDGRG